jgi:putative methyltransferase (TIGR04325 family)
LSGWNDAAAATEFARWPDFCRRVSGTNALGVNHESPTASQHDLRAHNTVMSFGYVLAMAARFRDRLSILDFGGGIGHYYLLTKALLPELEVNYCCQELPAMTKIGRLAAPGVTFIPHDATYDRRYELVMASGSLQYSEDWKKVVNKLARAADSYLYLTRVAVVRSADCFTVIQRPYELGYSSKWVLWVFNRDELISCVETEGFQLVREFYLEPGPVVTGTPEESAYYGFLFARKRVAEGLDVAS